MMKQSLDTKLARTAAAMSNCDEDQPIDLCHIVTIKEARDELARLSSEIAALTERAERAERLYEAAKPLADMMSLAAFRSNPRMSDGYCPPMGGVKEYELRHQAAAIRDAVEKYDTARREAGRDATDSAVAKVEGGKA